MSDKKLTGIVRHYLKSQSGQSVILISMVILSFLMFFSFAINTGVLITAKISVQSAADAAAYAGAATQARQLNAISFLNYDMRRQFKKFTYRYAFQGNIAARNFPNDTAGATPDHYGFPKKWYATHASSSAQIIPLKVPVVCIPLTGSSAKSENCVNLNLPSSSAQFQDYFPAGGLTMITQQMLQSSAQISATQDLQCGKTGSANLFVTTEWLMRGDISPNAIANTMDQMGANLNASDKANLTNVISNLVHGLGLYPRNIITLMRIDTLKQFLNESAKKDVQKDQIESWEKTSSAEVHERTIQAFKSALSNLNNEVISHDSVILQELQNDKQIELTPVEPSFNVYVQYMAESTSGGDTICNNSIIPFRAKKVPAGVVRSGNTTVPVHYAVKLKAKAKLLFLPIKEGIELEAFASAKPFGSRVGPATLNTADFVENIQPPNIGSKVVNDCSDGDTQCFVPNFKISAADTYYSPGYLQALAQLGITPISGGGNAYTFQGMNNAIAPQPYEVGHYNIIPPPKTAAEMAFEFIPYAINQNSQIYRFYAPIFTGTADTTKKVKDIMDAVFGQTQVSGTGTFTGVDMIALRGTLETELNAYINGPLNQGLGASEHGETTTFAAIQLPMAVANPPIQPNPNKYWLTTANEVRSSWAPDYGRLGPGNIGHLSRFGYSVKFVAMQNLLQSGMNSQDDDQGNVSH